METYMPQYSSITFEINLGWKGHIENSPIATTDEATKVHNKDHHKRNYFSDTLMRHFKFTKNSRDLIYVLIIVN